MASLQDQSLQDYCFIVTLLVVTLTILWNFSKFCRFEDLIILGPNFPTLLKDFILEISAMHTLNNRYLLPLYGVVLSNPIKIISQLAPDGNLISKLRKRKLHSLIRFIVHKIFLDFQIFSEFFQFFSEFFQIFSEFIQIFSEFF